MRTTDFLDDALHGSTICQCLTPSSSRADDVLVVFITYVLEKHEKERLRSRNELDFALHVNI